MGMRFSQEIALEISQFIYENYLKKHVGSGTTVTVPWIGTIPLPVLPSQVKVVWDWMMSNFGNTNLTDKKIRSAANIFYWMDIFVKLDLDKLSDEKRGNEIKNTMKQYITEMLKREEESSKISNTNTALTPKNSSAAATSTAPITAPSSTSITAALAATSTPRNPASSTESLNVTDSEMPKPLQTVTKKKTFPGGLADDQIIHHRDLIDIHDFYDELQSDQSIRFTEVYFMTFLYVLINAEIKKINIIEKEADWSQGSYDVALRVILKSLEDHIGLLNYRMIGLDRFAEHYVRSSLGGEKINLQDHLAKLLLKQHLKGRLAMCQYAFNLDTLTSWTREISQIPRLFLFAADTLLRGSKPGAYCRLSDLMMSNLALIQYYVINERRAQFFLQSMIYDLSEIEKISGVSLKTFSETLKAESIGIEHQAFASTPKVGKPKTPSAQGTASAALSATTSMPVKQSLVDQKSAMDQKLTEPVSENQKTSIRGRKFSLTDTERRPYSLYTPIVMSLPQRKAEICANLIHSSCIVAEPISPLHRINASLDENNKGVDASQTILSTLEEGTKITAANAFHEALEKIVFFDPHHKTIRLTVLRQDPKKSNEELRTLVTYELSQARMSKKAPHYINDHYVPVLESCWDFLSRAKFLEKYDDWYLQIKNMQAGQHAVNLWDNFTFRLMNEFLSFNQYYFILKMKNQGIQFSHDLDMNPSEAAIPLSAFDEILNQIQESLEECLGESGEYAQDLLITFKSLLYNLKCLELQYNIKLSNISELEDILNSPWNQSAILQRAHYSTPSGDDLKHKLDDSKSKSSIEQNCASTTTSTAATAATTATVISSTAATTSTMAAAAMLATTSAISSVPATTLVFSTMTQSGPSLLEMSLPGINVSSSSVGFLESSHTSAGSRNTLL